MLSNLGTLSTSARKRYITLLANDLSRARDSLRSDADATARQQALHSLVGVLGTAGAPCYMQALEAERLERQQRLPDSELNALLAQIDSLLKMLDQQMADL